MAWRRFGPSTLFLAVGVRHHVTATAFQLPPGAVLGLLGRTSSGKTTLTRLLFRLFDPTAGTIRLGDTDLRDTRLVELRQRIGLVTQEVQLFHATVRDNLTFFDPSIPDGRIVAVLDRGRTDALVPVAPGRAGYRASDW